MMNAEKNIRSFENRCRGLKKKLGELSTLCDVEVCMVCTHPSSSHMHLWPEDPSKVEQTITNYRMAMMKSCGNNKKNKVLLHSLPDINGSGREMQVPVSDEQHLNFLGKAHDGKTKEEIFLESLPYEKLKEFMSALKGKIEQVKQEIAVKKMQAELTMELISDTLPPTSVQGENEAATSSSYAHQKMMMGPAAGMMGMQNHLIAVPSMEEMTNNPFMPGIEVAYGMPQPHLAALPPIHNIMWVPQNQLTPAIPAMPEMMLTSQNCHHHHHHVIYGNYSANKYVRDVHAFNF